MSQRLRRFMCVLRTIGSSGSRLRIGPTCMTRGPTSPRSPPSRSLLPRSPPPRGRTSVKACDCVISSLLHVMSLRCCRICLVTATFPSDCVVSSLKVHVTATFPSDCVVSSYKVHVTATLFSDFVALCVREATATPSLRRRGGHREVARTSSTTMPRMPPTVAGGTHL
jgi:hypothetical protein